VSRRLDYTVTNVPTAKMQNGVYSNHAAPGIKKASIRAMGGKGGSLTTPRYEGSPGVLYSALRHVTGNIIYIRAGRCSSGRTKDKGSTLAVIIQ
jgi:hypothetical protein